MLDLIGDALGSKGITFSRIDGQIVNIQERQKIINSFNKKDLTSNLILDNVEKIFNENSNTKLNNKTYNKIMDRIKYFIKKTKK